MNYFVLMRSGSCAVVMFFGLSIEMLYDITVFFRAQSMIEIDR